MVDPQVDALDELDGVEDQTAGLEDNWRIHADSKYKEMYQFYRKSIISIGFQATNQNN